MRCTHPACGREDLPPAAAFPPAARVAAAHVNLRGEPCLFSPGPDVYDVEVLAMIVTDDRMWDLGDVEPRVLPEPLRSAAALIPTDTAVERSLEVKMANRLKAKPLRKLKPASAAKKAVADAEVDDWTP
jgi:hypothetical protein